MLLLLLRDVQNLGVGEGNLPSRNSSSMSTRSNSVSTLLCSAQRRLMSEQISRAAAHGRLAMGHQHTKACAGSNV